MSPSRGPKITKTKTFAGCWTCRRRKIKCDNSRPCCRRCGDSCEGYNVTLYWMADANERACAVRRKAMLIRDPRLPVSCVSTEIDRMLEELETKATTTDTDAEAVVGPFTAFGMENMAKQPLETSVSLRTRPGEWREDTSSPYLYRLSLYVNNIAAELMHNYVHVVSQVLQPIHHPHNPYRSIYAQQAISAGKIIVGAGGTSSQSATALSHALLAVSAFHLYRCHPQSPHYGDIARLHRLQAMLNLRNALAQGEGETNYYTTMSAMLSMVSIDLMEGGMTEFWIHLQGCDQLSILQPYMLDPSLRRDKLRSIGCFMSVLSQSTNPYMTPMPWMRQIQDVESLLGTTGFHSPDHLILEYTYGTTACLATYLELTISLSQSLTYYNLHKQPVPETLHRAQDLLQNKIRTWSISQEPVVSLLADDDEDTRALISCHVVAFHAATAIYFYTMLDYPVETTTLKTYRMTCVSNLLAAEALKASDSARTRWGPMAPIAWPGFIAGCEADLDERELWETWWTESRKYCLGSIETLWKIVREVWKRRDAGLIEGDIPGWMWVLRRQRRRAMSGG
ncbi:hypothetical protein FE257_005868 [Aspergillus nanangensis]|uniref:Zn(2)-C6 fungal-type domain-containing protein n=1 Tax=Aspergillus nanangensis TaxID=2582783 RepID=A0AAD4CRH8_ASPNN|nr:hypothetical protein FE257_005868 [Aspergillus nanangensis]